MNTREIKFRAKVLNTNPELNGKEWAYGMPVPSQFGCGYMLDIDSCKNADFFNSRWTMPSCESTKPIDEDTIGQYRCKKDKNKNEIYDGDIIEYYDYDQDWVTGDIEFSLKQYVVGYEDDFGIFNPIPDLERLADIYNVDISELTEDDNKYVGISVIGNIYDNPELIDE